MDAYLGNFHFGDCTVDLRLERRLDRIIREGSDGDDMNDVGRKSKEFVIRCRMTVEQVMTLDKLVGEGETAFRCPYGEYKAVVKYIDYKAATGDCETCIIEDIE